jgi:ankyrin repeat protein
LADANEQAAVACRNALFLTDPHSDREKVISAKGPRVAGTCEWITRDASYCAWLNSDGSDNSSNNDNTRLLWLSGGPGKGKTMLSVFLTEELQKHTARIEGAKLVFFFCNAEDGRRNTAAAVLRGLVRQIIVKRPQLVKHALPDFETPERTQQTLSCFETLWVIFSKLVADAELGTMFCVLDGLDECEASTLRALVSRIVNLFAGDTVSSAEGTFKLAIVSRDIPGLQGCTRIRLDPDNDEKVGSDIALFVSDQVAKLSWIEGFNDIQASVHTALLKRAEGTFLWVGFAMHELSQKQTCSEIIEALESMPSGLPAIYGRMLLRIPAKKREISCAILQWVTMAACPLQLQELAAAVDIQAALPCMTVVQAARDAVVLCGPLLKVQEQEVSLIHQSARDYLLRKERNSNTVLEVFQLESESAHFKLAHKCLNCIAQSDLQHRAIDFNAELSPQEPPLLRYATRHWFEHAKSCSALAAKLFDPSGLFLQKESSLRDNWWKTHDKMKNGYLLAPPPLLHMACILEIVPWVEAVLAKRSWRPRYHRRVNEKDSDGRTALHGAAWGGNKAVVWLLVDRGADVKARANDGRTVLHWAVSEGNENEAVVRLLVDRGADVKAKDNYGHTVLHSAAWRGNEAVVWLLVDRGADVKAKANDGRTVLHWAARGGNEAVVRLLVDRGADVKAKANDGRTVLHWAAWRGNEAVVWLLVDRGADVKAKANDGQTVLHWAARGGNEAVVRLLVDRGADIKAKANDGKTVLQWAARGGNEAVVRLLVDRGADVKAKDNDERIAL